MRKFSAIDMDLMKHKENIIPFALLIGVFIFVSLYTTTTNIHGDGLTHALFAKEIVESQNLLSFYPHFIMESDSNGIIYMPISYPQLAHVSMSLFYLVGGELALKFISAFFAAIVSLFVYLLFRDISKFIALSCSLLVVIINSQRFIGINPLMEPILLFGAIASIYFFNKYFKTSAITYLVLTALFLGFTASIKQQGMIFSFVIFAYIVVMSMYNSFVLKKVKLLSFKHVLLMFLIFSFVAFGPISEQIMRNGTIDFVPTDSDRIPLLTPKYASNPESSEALQQWLSPNYWPHDKSLLDVVKEYALWPLFYNRFVSVSDDTQWYMSLALFLLGFIYLLMNKKILLSILLFPLIVEILTTYLVPTPIGAYHVIGLGFFSIFLPIGLFAFMKLLPKTNRKTIRIFAILLLTILLVSSYVQYVHIPLWDHSGRIDDATLNSYINFSTYISASDIPQNSIFLGQLFRYYVDVDQIWMNAGGGTKIPLILSTQNERVALYWLNYYNIDYVAIDVNQTKRRGVNDYIPSDGLLSYIDNSTHFEKIYDDDILKLYEIKY